MGKLNKTAIIQLIAIFAFGCAIGVAFPSLWDLFNNQPLRGFEGFYYLISPIVTGAAAIGAIYYALKVRDGNLLIQKQVELAREGQLAERYARAAEMLSSDQRGELREAGILQLKALALTDTTGDYYFPVQNLLCTFIRSRSRSYSHQYDTSSSLKAAIRAISELRNEVGSKHDDQWRPQLGDANFRRFYESKIRINFKNADLFKSTFATSNIENASFENANLFGSSLAATTFKNTNFTGAELKEANLQNMVIDTETLDTLTLDPKKWVAINKGDNFRITHAQPREGLD
ncbi:pentapeptide repeat-containing protein [Cohaesibacter marisflavi]|uniref:pentapeptide repeat-containing protein n=1 Tax=Cohaesibacter marisflavi TaxID=655353 RepID=UPI0029C93850|nr:pentapeptide repeat-containing protein [Cohaesibacter marisflavi]